MEAETDQFMEGLKSLGVLDSIRKHMTMLKLALSNGVSTSQLVICDNFVSVYTV